MHRGDVDPGRVGAQQVPAVLLLDHVACHGGHRAAATTRRANRFTTVRIPRVLRRVTPVPLTHADRARHLSPRLPRLVRVDGDGRRQRGPTRSPSSSAATPSTRTARASCARRSTASSTACTAPTASSTRCAASGRRAAASSSRSRGTTALAEIASRLHDVIDAHGAEAVMPFSDAGNQSVLALQGTQQPLLQPHRSKPSRPRDLRPDRRRRRVDDERLEPGHGPARDPPRQADHPLGDEHQAHQPPPVADHRGGPRRRRQGRRDRSDPDRHGRGRRLVRAAADRAPTSR